MSSLFLSLALAAYLLSCATFVAQVITGHDALRRVAHYILACGFVAHAVSLAIRAMVVGYAVIAAFHDELSFIACLMVGLYLLLAARTKANIAVVGGLVTPLAFLFSLSAHAYEAFHPATPETAPRILSVWLPAHVAPAFLGYAVFALACCLSLIYLLQERQLKAKRSGDLFRRLPSLETLDQLNYRFVSWGFALFTVAMITGSLLAWQMWGTPWSWEPVQVSSLVTWLLYASLLHARTVGWRGRKAAALTIVGFVVVTASLLSMNLLFPGRHGISLN